MHATTRQRITGAAVLAATSLLAGLTATPAAAEPTPAPPQVTFTATTTTPVPQRTSFAAITTDLDGDGHQDILSGFSGNYTIEMGLGDGAFAPVTVHPFPGVVSRPAVGDVDEDGVLDLVNVNSGIATTLIGNGDGTFSEGRSFLGGVGGWGTSTLTDLDLDGDLDLLSPEGDTVVLLTGDGEGGFEAGTVLAHPGRAGYAYFVETGDVDGDGSPDVVVSYSGTASSAEASISVYLSDGHGGHEPPVSLANGYASYQVAVADLDDDDRAEIVFVDAGVRVHTYDPGTGGFVTTAVPADEDVTALAVADLDLDGFPDIATVTPGWDPDPYVVEVLLGSADGFSARVPVYEGDTVSLFTMSVGDVDLDGQPDLVLPRDNPASTTILRNATSDPAPPTAPQDVEASQTGAGQVTVTWDAPVDEGTSPVTGYDVGYGDGGSGTGQQVGADARSTTFTGLAPGDYQASVVAISEDGESAPAGAAFTVTAPVVDLPPAAAPPSPAPAVEPVFTPTTPVRVLDTRGGEGTAGRSGDVIVQLPSSVPSGATVLLNLTSTGATTAGHVVAHEAGTVRPRTSNLNFAPGRTQANLTAVRVSSSREVVLAVTGTTHLVADLVGSFTGTADGFDATDPTRTLDTRLTGGAGADGSAPIAFPVPSTIPSDATHLLVNVTTTGARGSGYVATPRAAGASRGTSALNYTAGLTQANLVPVPIRPDRTVVLQRYGAVTDVVVDVQGHWTGTLVSAPARLLDTRDSGRPVTRVATFTLTDVPAGVTTALVNLTVTGGTADGHAVVRTGDRLPGTSNVNWQAGQTQANLVLVPITADGVVTVRVVGAGSVHVVADLVGYQR